MSHDVLDIPRLDHRQILDRYLPTGRSSFSGPAKPNKNRTSEGIETQRTIKPFVTLTYAQSLDSRISAAPGERTALSGLESKAMTHYLRGHHDAVIVGGRTAKVDDPGLNCRLPGAGRGSKREDSEARNEELKRTREQRPALDQATGPELKQPRPVVLDRHALFDIDPTSKLYRLARSCSEKPPWILCSDDIPQDTLRAREETLRKCGGQLIRCVPDDLRDLARTLSVLGDRGIESVMIEGGASVIDRVLGPVC